MTASDDLIPLRPDCEIAARDFGVDNDMRVPAFSQHSEYVPDRELRSVAVRDAEMYTYAHVFCLKERREARLVRAFLGIVGELLRQRRPGRTRKKSAMS